MRDIMQSKKKLVHYLQFCNIDNIFSYEFGKESKNPTKGEKENPGQR